MQQTQLMTCWPDASEEATINQPNRFVRQVMTVSEFTTSSKYGLTVKNIQNEQMHEYTIKAVNCDLLYYTSPLFRGNLICLFALSSKVFWHKNWNFTLRNSWLNRLRTKYTEIYIFRKQSNSSLMQKILCATLFLKSSEMNFIMYFSIAIFRHGYFEIQDNISHTMIIFNTA